MRGWKTLAVNLAIGGGVLVIELLTFFGAADWHSILPPDRATLVVLVLGVANILLRHVTSGPAGWRRGKGQ